MIVVAIVGMLSAIAFPSFRRVIALSRQDTCLNALKQIDSAKEQWALENNQSNGADPTVPAPSGLTYVNYLKDNQAPICPSGSAVYQVNNVGTPPACTGLEAAAHNFAYQNP